MNIWHILLAVYLVSAAVLAIYLFVPRKGKGRRVSNDRTEKVFAAIALLFAPVTWVIGAVVSIPKRKKDGPQPLPEHLLRSLKKDCVSYEGKIMSIAKVNRLTGKNYTLDRVYGKRYVAAITDGDREEFDTGESSLRIGDKVRRDDDFEIVRRFAEARMSGDLQSVRDLFDPDAVLVVWGKNTFHGVDGILAFWKERYESSVQRRVKFDFEVDMCMFYNGPAMREKPEGFAHMLVMFRILDGGISQMVLTPEFLNTEYMYFGSFREAPYTTDYFWPHFREILAPVPNLTPCPCCGTLSENLEWRTFDTANRFDHFRYEGDASFCPHCGRTVEIVPKKRFENEYQSKHPHEEYAKENAPVAIPRPELTVSGFVFSRPLAGTEYVSRLDGQSRIELETCRLDRRDPEAEPYTVRECAERFNCLLLSQLSRKDRPLFEEICSCFQDAWDDGLAEAGNNLGILYYNYGDREEDGLAIWKESADKGCANAATNYFTALWGSGEHCDEAVRFAVGCKNPSIGMCWNLAVLYLCGPDIKENPLEADRVKAKELLNRILSGSVPSAGDDSHTIRRASDLLKRIDDYDPFVYTAREYVEEAIPRAVRMAERDWSQENDLCRTLRHIRFADDVVLKLRLPKRDGPGDVSRFLLLDRDDRDNPDAIPLYVDEDILVSNEMEVERSVYGAWNAYLFIKARNLLPTWWHGGYNRETLLFDKSDLDQIFSQRGRVRDVILKGDDLRPRVRMDGDTAIIESCSWSEWGGLSRETWHILFEGDHVTDFKQVGEKNLYIYDCGILF